MRANSPSRSNKLKPFGIKWPDEPIKALGVYYTYDIKLLHEKNFIERLDSVKKLINIWSSRGLSLYGKVTIIKSLLIPKFVYILPLLPAPKGIVQELNRMLFKFLWKGTDKVTRLSTINDYENGGLKPNPNPNFISQWIGLYAWKHLRTRAHRVRANRYNRVLSPAWKGIWSCHENSPNHEIPRNSPEYHEILPTSTHAETKATCS